jgi:hypothetical protein
LRSGPIKIVNTRDLVPDDDSGADKAIEPAISDTAETA